jgi:N-acetylmuramoyl-L-alanine amidase
MLGSLSTAGPALRRAIRLLFVLCLAFGAEVRGARFSTVVIDAGHGGKDKGAYWGGVRESHLNLQVAQRLEQLLKRKGMKTAMTRRSDIFVSLGSRVAVANRYASSVFVSIHFNASTDRRYRGVETFYAGPAGRKLAQSIQSRLASRLKTNNRGVKRRSYKVLRLTSSPAVLVECGFLSNTAERGRCKTTGYQQTAAQAICDGIMAAR